MKILITGASGFVGKNLTAELENRGYKDLLLFSRENSLEELKQFTKECEFIFHLAGANRPVNDDEFMRDNFGFTLKLIELLKMHHNKSPILLTSSIQAALNTPYGRSKKAGEDLVFGYGDDMGVNVLVYRLPNLFGKWSKPNYNSVVATYCYNIARNIDIHVNNPETVLNLYYIDDVLEEFLKALEGSPTRLNNYCTIQRTYSIKLGELAELIESFPKNRIKLNIPNMEESLTKKLYSTYLSFLPKEQFSYDLTMNIDNRGSFTEFIRTSDRGQVSVNVSKPGITKGNHWHHTKSEKFLVVSGEGLIRLKEIHTAEIIEYRVSGEKLQVVDIPVGYTHSIVNTSNNDMITVIWANECFNAEKPDTFYLDV